MIRIFTIHYFLKQIRLFLLSSGKILWETNSSVRNVYMSLVKCPSTPWQHRVYKQRTHISIQTLIQKETTSSPRTSQSRSEKMCQAPPCDFSQRVMTHVRVQSCTCFPTSELRIYLTRDKEFYINTLSIHLLRNQLFKKLIINEKVMLQTQKKTQKPTPFVRDVVKNVCK